MSRRLNRDPVPLHKPEACSDNLQWLDAARVGYYTTLYGFAGFLDSLSMGMYLRWSLRGHTYCCGSERGSFHQ